MNRAWVETASGTWETSRRIVVVWGFPPKSVGKEMVEIYNQVRHRRDGIAHCRSFTEKRSRKSALNSSFK